MRIEIHMHSSVLGMDMPVNVILPQEQRPAEGSGRLPVLWLLHGGSGDHTAWLRMSAAERCAVERGIAVVTPGGLNSCFTDLEHGLRFHTYLTEELPSQLRQLLPRLSSNREENFISGYSNGGYGCLKAGLSRPDLYGAIGAFSAGDKSDVPFVNDGSPRARERILLFGDGSLKQTDRDLQHLARQALESGQPLPRIYHACGSLDPWLDLNWILRDFFEGLGGNPFDYQYHQRENMGHSWDFWDRELPHFLAYLGLAGAPGRFVTGM